MEAYKDRMIKEYRDLKEKYNKLHKMIVKYEAGTLGFEPTCPMGLLREQKSHMGQYLNILEIRAEIEGIGYDNLLYDCTCDASQQEAHKEIKSLQEKFRQLKEQKYDR